jgi:hypothetical protein
VSATHGNWDDWSFWAAVRLVMDKGARQSGGHDGLEALSAIWEVFKKRFPNGEVPGPNSSAFISKTIHLETRKYFQKRENRLLPSADFDLSHLMEIEFGASALANRPRFPETISQDQFFAILSPAERDLICRRFGINRDVDAEHREGARDHTPGGPQTPCPHSGPPSSPSPSLEVDPRASAN